MGLFSSEKKRTSQLQSLTDEQLVSHYAFSHDPECIAILYERYTHLVLAVCIKFLRNDDDAEDMVMLIFEKLIKELKATRVENFKSWLFTLTRNQCLMSLRHGKTAEKYREENLRKLEAAVMESGAGMHLFNDDEDNSMMYLDAAVSSLNEAQSRCIRLFYLEEKSYREVSEITGFSLNEVKSHIQNGKRNLKISLEKTRKS